MPGGRKKVQVEKRGTSSLGKQNLKSAWKVRLGKEIIIQPIERDKGFLEKKSGVKGSRGKRAQTQGIDRRSTQCRAALYCSRRYKGATTWGILRSPEP